MRYYLDTEFIERFDKPLFRKRRHFIDLISIGILAGDGRQYYAISNEFKFNDADDWVKENVISKLKFWKNGINNQKGEWIYGMEAANFGGKTNKQIAYEIFRFIHYPVYKKWDDKISFIEEIVDSAYKQGEEDHEFYAYYADYDWVLFCSLFGRMIDLPKGFPMYCNDLKQELDQKIINAGNCIDRKSFDKHLEYCKSLVSYPKQTNEHDALSDAIWNYELHNFIQSI